MLRLLVSLDGNQAACAKAVQLIPEFEKVDQSMISRWQKKAVNTTNFEAEERALDRRTKDGFRKVKTNHAGGRPVSHEFDTQVWGEVVIVALDNSEDV